MIVHGKCILSGEDDRGLKQNAVYIVGDTIRETGDFEDLRMRYPDEEVIGRPDQAIMAGFVDAHTHGAGLSFVQRGLEYDFLENALLSFECALDIEPEINSMLNAVRHIRNGCTTIHHNNWTMPLDINELRDCEKKVEAYRKTGIRLGFSVGTRIKNLLAYDDRNFLKTLPEALQKEVAYLVDIDQDAAIDHYFETFEALYQKYNGESTKIFFGPSWVQGSTDAYLKRVKQRADELGRIPIHIHTLQTPVQKAYGIRTYGKSLVEYLDDIGLVGENLVLGHAVFLNRKDIEILAGSNASVTHHPSCNMVMRNGIAPVYDMLKAGVNVAMGIDEKGINDDEDAIMEMRMIYMLHRVSGLNLSDTPPLSPRDVLKVCTRNGSRVTGFGEGIGAVEAGKKADLILVDLKEITEEPWCADTPDIAGIFVHRAMGRHVDTVIIGGKPVMKGRKILTVDVESLYREAAAQARRGRTSAQKDYERKMNAIKPYYQQWYNGWLKELALEPYYPMNSQV